MATAAGNSLAETGEARGTFGAFGAPKLIGARAIVALAHATLPVLMITRNLEFAARMPGALRNSGIDLTVEHALRSCGLFGELPSNREAKVVVVDGGLADIGSLRASAAQRFANPGARLMLIFDRIPEQAVELSLQTRARGCIDFSVTPENFARAVRAVSQGELWFPRWMVEPLYRRALPRSQPAQWNETVEAVGEELTARELEVIQLVHRGLTNKEIGQELAISPHTVKKHVHNALVKSGLRRRRQLLK